MPRKPKSKDSQKPPAPSKSQGRFSYQGLDRVMHEKARLGILASLAANAEGLMFNDLKQLCSLTDGNLSQHLRVLSEAGLVEIWKGNTGSRPQTMSRLTNEGRQRFADYISVLETIVADAQPQSDRAQSHPESDQRGLSGGLSPT